MSQFVSNEEIQVEEPGKLTIFKPINNMEKQKEYDWDQEAGVTGALEGNPKNFKRLKPIQYKAISLLLQGETQSAVASDLGVSRKSIGRWMQEGSLFREIYLKRQHDIWEATNHKLQALQYKAISVLENAMESRNENTRIKAAAIVVRHIKVQEPCDINSLPKEEFQEYEERKRRGGKYYAYLHEPDSDIDIASQSIPWDKSTHQCNSDYDHFPTYKQENLLLNEDELDNFANLLAVRKISCEKVQDVVAVLDRSGTPFCSIYSSRAEQESVINWSSLTKKGRKAVYAFLKPSKETMSRLHEGYDCHIRIPSNVSINGLVELLVEVSSYANVYNDRYR